MQYEFEASGQSIHDERAEMDAKPKTLTPRQRERRETILKTVRDHLAQYGYDELSMRKIAAAASVSPSTLYEIYDSKDSLILYAIGESLNKLSEDESKYQPGLDRFLRRLESIAELFLKNPQTGEAITKLLFQNSSSSIAKEVLLVNAINARRVSLEEMVAQRQLIKDVDIDFYARSLISLTWGTALFWQNRILEPEDVSAELIRSSMAILLPISTGKAKQRIQDILR